MKPFNRVNEADLAFFESILPGRVLVVTICAMMLPPNAGRICTRSVFSRSSSRVQSAVRPV